jgi:16S rRNA G966 N2-methylase RsmD
VITKSYKWHPQPSSIRKATGAALNGKVRGLDILDCFCGTGAHCLAVIKSGAKSYTGTDIEDFSFCIRKDVARYNANYEYFGDNSIRFMWGIDAKKAVKSFDYDLLFTDPPNPYQIVGGAPISLYLTHKNALSFVKKSKYCQSRSMTIY